jgi:GTP:adenosylcobinamide-phosphate guanylyltransferase
MRIKKYLTIVLLCIFSSGFSQNIAEGSFSYERCYLNYIKIEGETNLNQFVLTYDNSNVNNISVAEKSISEKSKKSLVEFKIPVKAFKGNNYLMVNDFRNMVDASNHPLIIVEIERNIFDHVYLNSDNSVINFNLTIAGETQNVNGEYKIHIRDNNIVLCGQAILKLSDFSIEPPQKMFGMLQVKDIIIIKFDILILSTNS